MKSKLSSKLRAKILAWFLLAFALLGSLLSVAGIAIMVDAEVYTTSKQTLKENNFSLISASAADDPAGSGDLVFWIDRGIDLLYNLRYGIYAILAACVILAVVCFVFLLCGAGHREGREDIVPGPFGKLPFDLFTAVMAALVMGALALFFWALEDLPFPWSAGIVGLSFLCGALLLTGWCVSLAARIKSGAWWKRTIIYLLLHGLWRGLRAVGRWLWTLLRGLPLIWKTLLGCCVMFFGEFFWWSCFRQDTDVFLFGFLLEKIALLLLLLWAVLALRRLQKGGAALAAGDLSYHVDTRGMFWDFKQHGEHLNSIAGGMTKAVEERTKSERLKTELITNVSHDIKTPLTSIINYVGLLSQEHTPEENAAYLEVLQRQSRKLKKLTEDLVEVSKASTGNLELQLSRQSANELLRQVLGEYSERLSDAGLETVLTLPPEECFLMADGTLLWRILDNLCSNVCKYAQPGTRFYAETRPDGNDVRFSFKNISREPLNLSADELAERFVRGDNARTGEGSGLGLSIAKSLTEAMGGVFTLTVDGDLFKAELTLPGA